MADLKTPVVCAALRLIGHISLSHILSLLVIVVIALHRLDVIGRQFLQEMINYSYQLTYLLEFVMNGKH